VAEGARLEIIEHPGQAWCDWILARRHQLLAENISHLERNLATLKQQLRTD
jgi:hypothetical protein